MSRERKNFSNKPNNGRPGGQKPSFGKPSRSTSNDRRSNERSSDSRDRFESSDRKSSFGKSSRPNFSDNTQNKDRSFPFGKPSFASKGKKGGRDFDTRDKYENGDRKYVASKSYKKPYDRQAEQNDKIKGYILKRKLDKLSQQQERDTIRLNKYIANSGICSRREADELITQGLVEVNGKVVTEMGYQVQKTDRVVFDGQGITPEKPVYVLLNKPKGYISTTKDEKMRKTVMDLVANASPYRLYPVGRLDRSTTGVILLTNDGHLTKKLTHPSFNMKKIYHVTLDKKVSSADLEEIRKGIRLEEGVAEVDNVSFIEGKPKNEVGIEIHIGWNRVVRRIFQRLGYEVEALDRVMFAGLTKKNVKRGHWRILNDLEVNNLKML
ncbi:pseudouridine synthase [Elizabethkingia sp. JS20170427COW]|uniref:pseudouridine synthase n=1 Tax=Elizabethkingia sp. JS20170427COW TaxID=2583851 RepID=UPI001110430A|nr:pseudouridine synthase [Elizabethkingia sp. JS20170427COW]QCX54279.1 rRNA pseudouridine synthase [Elizabethkingia sp. JS20170427COW]